jgi:hypothetical protein
VKAAVADISERCVMHRVYFFNTYIYSCARVRTEAMGVFVPGCWTARHHARLALRFVCVCVCE